MLSIDFFIISRQFLKGFRKEIYEFKDGKIIISADTLQGMKAKARNIWLDRGLPGDGGVRGICELYRHASTPLLRSSFLIHE